MKKKRKNHDGNEVEDECEYEEADEDKDEGYEDDDDNDDNRYAFASHRLRNDDHASHGFGEMLERSEVDESYYHRCKVAENRYNSVRHARIFGLLQD